MATITEKITTKTFSLNGKTFNCEAKVISGKRRYHGGWKAFRSTIGHCDALADCEWFADNTDGNKTASFSCIGWEPNAEGFGAVDAVVTAMIRELKGWAEPNEVENELARIAKEGK